MQIAIAIDSFAGGKPPLDIHLFRDEKKAETVRESQRRRFPVDQLEDIAGENDEAKLETQKAQAEKQKIKVALVVRT